MLSKDVESLLLRRSDPVVRSILLDIAWESGISKQANLVIDSYHYNDCDELEYCNLNFFYIYCYFNDFAIYYNDGQGAGPLGAFGS